MRKRVGKRHAPEMRGRFSVAASGRKTAETSDTVPNRQPRSKYSARCERGHLIFAQEPPGDNECRNQPAREHAACLQRVEGEDLTQILAVHVTRAPVENHIKN